MIVAIVVITIVSAGTSFLCSLMEAALYSITRAKIEELRAAGSKGGERLAKLRANVDEPIAAILTLNTIANSAGAAFAGALVGMTFTEHAAAATAVYSVFFVLLVLYVAEIVPKTLGVTHADRLAPLMSLPLLWIIRVAKPFVVTGQLITRIIRRNHMKEEHHAPSENEILAMAEMGARAGTILPDEARWAVNALRLNDVTARELMTPRTVVYMLPADMPLSEVTVRSEHWLHSRLPLVQNNNPDQVEGIVHRRDVFDRLAGKTPGDLAGQTLRDLMQPPVFAPETIRCNDLLRRFIETRQHLLIVTNEFGGMEGVISLEDVLEYILGEEIVDAHDKHADMQEYAREVARKKRRPQPPSRTPPPGAS